MSLAILTHDAPDAPELHAHLPCAAQMVRLPLTSVTGHLGVSQFWPDQPALHLHVHRPFVSTSSPFGALQILPSAFVGHGVFSHLGASQS